jgi:hypothetical protein
MYVYSIAISDNGIYHTFIFNCQMSGNKFILSHSFYELCDKMDVNNEILYVAETKSFSGVDVCVKKHLLIHNICSYKYFISKNTL